MEMDYRGVASVFRCCSLIYLRISIHSVAVPDMRQVSAEAVMTAVNPWVNAECDSAVPNW